MPNQADLLQNVRNKVSQITLVDSVESKNSTMLNGNISNGIPNGHNSEEVFISKLSGKGNGIYVLSLNRPNRANSLSRGMANQLQNSLDELAKCQDLRVLIIRSTVDGIFCAGADLKERATMREEDIPNLVSALRRISDTIYDFPMPTIAAIDGVAVGGGLEYALAADMRIISSNAKIGLVETKLAIVPGGGGTQRLRRLIPTHLAKELIFTGRRIDGNRAYQMGLANYLVEQNENGDSSYLRAVELAEEINKNGPLALKLSKLAINTGVEVDLRSGLAFESLCHTLTVSTRDRREGLNAYKEKRSPKYTGQ